MEAQLITLLAELEAFGDIHDDDAANHALRMLSVKPDTCDLLAVLVKVMVRAASLRSTLRTATRRCGWPMPPATPTPAV